MKLSKRLQVVASFIPDNSSLLDVGCDHALLDIYLMQTKKNIQIMASDINPNPLKIAKDNLLKYNFQNQITLKQMDGIKKIPQNIDTIVIAGMGGILITNILQKEKLTNIKNIILAPNNDFFIVRKHLNKLGYQIIKEQLVIDNQKTYLILKYQKGKEKIDYYFGTLSNNNLETIYYYTNILNKNIHNLKKIPYKYFIKRRKLKIENKKITNFFKQK